MYRPNSIQSRLELKENEPGMLLQDVNDTIESLKRWKEEQKKLDDDLAAALAIENPQHIDLDEEPTPMEKIEMSEVSSELLKREKIKLIEINDFSHPKLVKIPEIQNVNSFELYKAGEDLGQMLTSWNSELDFLMAKPKVSQEISHSKEWEQVDEIEKELLELEELMGDMSKLESDIID